ncbi:MAG: mechanosensitive ion channel family protein, partial [Treponema sp.]|nr:mechanosensitive ion channel family protein [Treponema sp.]
MNAQDLAAAAKKLFKDQNPAELLLKLAGIVFTAALILLAFSIIRYSLGKFLKGKISARRVVTARKAARYTGFAIALLYIFKSAGIDITAILGAAGVAGIVLGFAAQTSVSSLISGFFLMSEKPFTRGDTVKVGDITGIVLSADFLSVKLKTLDNLFVRIPNETLIKSNLINVTRFPIRRLDLSF